jgi:GDPmannose 4,6-dehydratase
MKPRALITGVTGQDGSYLAEFLLSKGYEVHGVVRRSSTENFERIERVRDQIHLHQADLLDQLSLIRILELSEPNEVYNLGSQSFVPTSFEQPILTGEFTALGVTRILEAVRQVNPKIKVYQASSSEMFGVADQTPQNEATPFRPRNPYGVAKLYGHWMSAIYREAYGFFTCSGILFNHESPRRGKEFVTRRISYGVAQIETGAASELRLGNLEAQRDWGFAGDYVEAMWLMLQQREPDDYVIATGVSHSVADFARLAFEHVGKDWRKYVKTDKDLVRPTELHALCGDYSKARRVLGWQPRMKFEELVRWMVDEDIRLSTQRKGSANREGIDSWSQRVHRPVPR